MKITPKTSIEHVRVLLIILLLSNNLLSISNAIADTNDRLPISLQDKHYLDDALIEIKKAGSLRTQLDNNPNYNKDNITYSVHLLREFVAGNREIIKTLQSLHSYTKDREIRKFYRIVFEGLRELADINLVGAALLEARETNDTDAVVALAASIISKEAKHLAMPILSRIVLEKRIKKFAERAEFRHQEVMKSMQQGLNELTSKRLL